MGQITIEKNVAGIEGLCVITPAVHGDNRGYFMETYSQRDMEEAGIKINFVQDKGCSSWSSLPEAFPTDKACKSYQGSRFDVAVDLRTDSETYGKWYGILLTEENKKQFLIPKGFAHGFLVLTDTAEFCYKCDDFYHPNDEGGLAWNDPAIGIEWPELTGTYNGSASGEGYALSDGTKLNLSDKDQLWDTLENTFKFD